MAKFLYKVGTFIAKHKWWTLAVWFVLLASIITPLIINPPEFDEDIQMNGLESLDTNEKIGDEFNIDSEKASIRVVFRSNKEKGITEESAKEDIKNTLDEIKKDDDYVYQVSNPYEMNQINEDQSTAFADINYVVSQTSMNDASKDNINEKLDDLEEGHNIQTELSDSATFDVNVGGTSEIIGIVVAFIILLITFGSFYAAGLPILSAIIGLGSSVGAIALLTYAFDIPNIALTLAVMIGLAVGIDYALFILFRYKQISKTEKDHVKAIGLAIGTAGSAIIFAGITVVIAVCGLALVGVDFLSVMGYAAAVTVFLAVLSALTLLPALISIFHKRIRPKKNKIKTKESIETPWSKFVVGKPIIAITISLVILGLAIIPAFDMRLGMPDDGMKPENSTQHKAYNIISDEFGEGYNGQIIMLVNTKDTDDVQEMEKELQNVVTDIKDFDNVETVTPPQLNENNDYALIAIIPEEGPNAESTNNLVYDLRDYNDVARQKYNFETEISGQSVINIDMSKKLNDAIPIFAGSIITLAFILLMIVFRSIIIPLKAVLGFVISLAATLGFTTLVMQNGFLAEIFGVSATGPLIAFLPIIVIGLLFGLAIDYEIFLMSRIHEEYSKTRNNEHSIKVGIKESGPVIVSAALIMFSVFIAFAFQDDVAVKSMGIALAFGVLFDAFIVRMTLIPALTKLFGRASWYLPKWLDRILPKIDVEGHELMDMKTEKVEHGESVENNGRKAKHQHSYIGLDERTVRLYEDLSIDSKDYALLYNALMYYAKENNYEIYNDYNLNTKNNSNKQDDLDKNDEE